MDSAGWLSDEVAWGLCVRGIALSALITFVSLHTQIVALVGSDGITPARAFLAHARKHVPGPTRFVHWPTLLWVACSDQALQGVCVLGAISALAVVVGGAWSAAAAVCSWACLVSLVSVASEFLLFPWDCVLLESSFLLLFAPAPLSLLSGSVAAATKPSLAAALAFRFLLFRVMFGMGMLKFHGKSLFDFFSAQNRLYLRWFMVQQPVPTVLAFYAYHYVPDVVYKAALLAMFAVEIVAPPLLFLPCPFSALAALPMIALQGGIMSLGNYGVFNVLTAVLALPQLTCTPDAALLWARGDAAWSVWGVLGACVLAVHGVLAVLQMPFSSYTTRFWMFSDPRPPWQHPSLQPLIDMCGWVAPLHLAHSYGVFGVDAPPPDRRQHKTVLVIEGTATPADPSSWLEYEWRYFASNVRTRPPFFAPHHPRVDQQVFYEGRDLRACHSNLLNPFRWDLSWMHALALALKRNAPAARGLFASAPFADGPPTHLRLRSYRYRFASPDEHAADGVWYVRESNGIAVPFLGRPECVELLEAEELPSLFVWWRRNVFERHSYEPDPPELVAARIEKIELYPGMFD
eukprot:TRINITY_DN16281_c0_g1_i1.p1 TRINITY_DN16281_c0_g1~~TRINITY_DN16281_c0_g1_i1.p1  ORF type:complete len:575 (-),score=202.43 TRINITY_DN16281_c0_g1_i1:125-1849(-)